MTILSIINIKTQLRESQGIEISSIKNAIGDQKERLFPKQSSKKKKLFFKKISGEKIKTFYYLLKK